VLFIVNRNCKAVNYKVVEKVELNCNLLSVVLVVIAYSGVNAKLVYNHALAEDGGSLGVSYSSSSSSSGSCTTVKHTLNNYYMYKLPIILISSVSSTQKYFLSQQSTIIA